ncbi:unnamed protein product, partial [marine sediment metagenome]
MENKPKLNILAYNFPPVGRSGSLRNLFYSKYFSEKFNVKIITAKNFHEFYTIDKSLLKKVPKNIKISRYKYIPSDPYLTFIPHHVLHILPDPHGTWKSVLENSKKEITDCDVLIVSIPPASSLLALEKLLSYKKPKQVILDFRDPWVSLLLRQRKHSFVSKYMTDYWARKKTKILKMVDVILVTSKFHKKWMAKDFPNIKKEKIKVIYNGICFSISASSKICYISIKNP